MESFLYRLEPADGIRSLPKVLELAGQHGLAVEVVALSDTADFPKLDLAGHVAAVGRTVAAYRTQWWSLPTSPTIPDNGAAWTMPGCLVVFARWWPQKWR